MGKDTSTSKVSFIFNGYYIDGNTANLFLVGTENSDEKVEFENFGRAGYI